MNSKQRAQLMDAIAHHGATDYLVINDRLGALSKLSDEELIAQIPKRYDFRNPVKDRRLVFEFSSLENLENWIEKNKHLLRYMKSNFFSLHSITKLIV